MSVLLALTGLAAAGDVLWYTGHGSGVSTTTHSTFDTAMNNAGASGVDSSSSWPSSITSYKVIVLTVSSSSYSTAEITDIESYLDSGGILVLMGEATGYNSAHVSVYNSLLSSLGLGSAFTPSTSLDVGCGNTATAATVHALNTSAASIVYAYSGEIALGSSATELFTGVSGQALIAYEDQVVLAADSNLFDDTCTLTSGNEQFFENLYSGVCEDEDADEDGDGYTPTNCGGTDCNDSDADINIDGEEVCDGVDNDCDGDVDDDDSDVDTSDGFTYYEDADGDGYGQATFTVEACDQPIGYVENTDDCDDNDRLICPGCAPSDSVTDCMSDQDRDGFGDDSPAAGVTAGTDCDDASDLTCPGCAPSDSATDCMVDQDLDGFGDDSPGAGVTAGSDCDDATALTCPGCAELDSTSDCMQDQDLDGYGNDSPSAGVTSGSDCDDNDPWLNPDGEEVCNNIDDDCNGTIDDNASDATIYYADTDGDGFGSALNSVAECSQPSGYLEDATDCDDTAADAYPGGTEVCDGLDNDCNGTTDDDDAADADTWYLDSDGDGFGDDLVTATACDEPSGYTSEPGDCDDGATNINPGAEEYCNSVDDDCDGALDEDAIDTTSWYPDLDGDGYGDDSTSVSSCDQPVGYVGDSSDCDDGDASVWTDTPGLTSSCVDDADGDDTASDDKGCSTVAGMSGGLMLALAGLWGRRRRL